jgi:hypothetical protein
VSIAAVGIATAGIVHPRPIPAQPCTGLPVSPTDRARRSGDRQARLRPQFTTYDAVYVALAEVPDASLHTCDAKLTVGHAATFVVHPGTH